MNSERTLGLIGHPVSHSLSPRIFAYFDPALDYQLIDCPAAELRRFFERTTLAGVNVTVPHKRRVLTLATDRTPRADQAGAANALRRTERGWLADNTDGVGLLRALSGHHGLAIRNQTLLILGAGGAVQNVLPALVAQEPTSITVANRSPQAAAELAERWSPVQAASFPEVETHYDLIIQATSAFESVAPLLPERLGGRHGYDLNYGSRADGFAMWCASRAIKHFDGLSMLWEQAIESYRFFFESPPQRVGIAEFERFRAELR